MSADWTARPEGGGRFALSVIRAIAVHGGRGLARVCLYPITLYFLLRRGPERRASRAYLSRIFGRRMGLIAVARHIHTFAATILDRVFLLARRYDLFELSTPGLEDLHAAMDEGKGVILMGSHLGSFEALRMLGARRPDVKIRVLLEKQQNPVLTSLLEALDPGIAETVIDAGQDGTVIVMQIKEALDEGSLVGMLADRVRPGEAGVGCRFIGGQVQMPAGPMQIAQLLDVPVVLCFGLYLGGRRYALHFERLALTQATNRTQRRAALASNLQTYAERLEHHARIAPYNWFNFYDYWDDAGQPDTRA